LRVVGDTNNAGIGVTVWAYTAEFGNGFSGTLSLENPGGHFRDPVTDVSNPAFFAANATVNGDTAFQQQQVAAGNNNGFRVPDIIGNLRVDQAWGWAGASLAIHEVGGSYYLSPNNINNGHPADRYGWAASIGGRLILPGNDILGANACYTEGAPGFCTDST